MPAAGYGVNGANGVNGADGINGADGVNGVNGANGANDADAIDPPSPPEEYPYEIVQGPLMKHPLKRPWCLWYFMRGLNPGDAQRVFEVITFEYIEDFWAVYHHIEVASRLKLGHDYALFRQGIQPKLEDEANAVGGRWIIQLDRSRRSTVLDKIWMELMLMMTGEAGERIAHDNINGAVVSVRRAGDIVALWTASTDEDPTMRIACCMKQSLGFVPPAANETIRFYKHADAINLQNAVPLYLM